MRAALFILVCLALAPIVAAQEQAVDLRRDEDHRNAFGIWSGVSFASPDWWGAQRERAVFLIGLRYRRTVSRSDAVALAYTFDVIPAATVANTPVRIRPVCCTGLAENVRRELERSLERVEPSTAYGFGVAPLGFQLELFRHRPVSLTLGGGGGLLFFDRDVPHLDTRKMNFTATLNAGLRMVIAEVGEVTLGYKYHHLSNAGTGTFNPGLDSSMLYLGWMRR